MSPAHVLEPTYAAIKQRLMAGAWPGGTRIEAARLAELLGVSITPVRDSLNRLAGERMVDFVAGEGFRVPRPGEIELRDLFALTRLLLLAAIGPAAALERRGRGGDLADRIGWLFLDLARLSANHELVAAVDALNDRLYLARTFDVRIFEDATDELAALEALASRQAAGRDLRARVAQYCHRREREAATFARLLAESEGTAR